MTFPERVQRLLDERVLDPSSVYLAEAMARLPDSGPAPEPLLMALAWLFERVARGHVCLELAGLGGSSPVGPDGTPLEGWGWPDGMQEALESSPLVTTPASGEVRPLVLDRGRLYLYRYWRYEDDLAERLARMIASPRTEPPWLDQALDELFDPLPGVSERRAAARAAISGRFTVITGGPGTGKTSTVVRILALYHRLATEEGRTPRVAMVAPTGKAAARMDEANTKGIAMLGEGHQGPRELVAKGASTIHRALGVTRRSRTRFIHGPQDPLDADLVVVDEASMVDLALMSKLVAALEPEARLVLLGDENQLASVEAGSVLADLCAPVTSSGFEVDAMENRVARLTQGLRAGMESGVHRLAQAIVSRDPDRVMALLLDPSVPDVSFSPLGEAELARVLSREVAPGFAAALAGGPPIEMLQGLGRVRVLTALRKGPWGAPALNEAIYAMVGRLLGKRMPVPVMVTVNDYEVDLFNGDQGVVVRRGPRGNARAYFPAPGGGVRALALSNLPRYEPMYAVTIHKSQGSEYGHVVVVLPDRDNPVLSMELLYTAVTRARESVTIVAPREILELAVSRKIRRESGLPDALWRHLGEE